MKFQVNRDVLAEAVAWTARVLPARPAVPVLAGLLLEAGDDLRVSAFDYDVSARAEIEADVAEPGRVLIPGRVLAEITRSLPARPVEIVRSGSEAVLTCGSAEFGLLTMPDEDFPTMPVMPPKVGAVGGGVFAAAVGQVAPAASRDDTLPMLTGVRIDIDGVQVAMAATDRYRIAAREFLWHPERDGERHGVVVPARVLVEVARSLRGGEVSIGLGDNVAGFESQGRVTTVRLLDDQFIDYRARLSEEWPVHADVVVGPFVEAIKRVCLVAERNTAVRLSFSQGQVLIQAGGGDIGRGAEVIEADLDGPDIQIAFQPHFLLDGLAGVETERVRVHMDSSTRPALVTDDGDDPGFRYLVMSLRLA
ncbi:DNA polymerase III subunit beta [Microbispora corallina]|uniref:Beta sliding clamp n=1 Tax=Microbispora corallina TaxID=83302 RepID=A0ABQ4G883_9ACTN|nr:DNA polymerase III subunit beta [Microbispora corallina]GIH43277.1 DNA polymerase III subunit beta [Microbispora corallina]